MAPRVSIWKRVQREVWRPDLGSLEVSNHCYTPWFSGASREATQELGVAPWVASYFPEESSVWSGALICIPFWWKTTTSSMDLLRELVSGVWLCLVAICREW